MTIPIPVPNLDSAQFAEATRLLGEIDELKGHWRKLGEIRAERLASLRQITTIESAGSSTRIEGAHLSDDEVACVLQGLEVDSFRSRDEEEVRGYAELLQTIFDHYEDLPPTENHLKQLNKILLGYSEKDAWHRGEYKKHENHLEARHPDGRIEVIFRTATPFDTPRLMAELLDATNRAFEERSIHPLFTIAHFVVAFLAIHPFQDGNGRLSRALTSLLMLRAGYEYVPYASVERVIEDNKTDYYLALRESQQAMAADPSAYGRWLIFFLRVLRTQKQVLEGKLEVERSILRISGVQLAVLEYVEKHGRATTPEIATALRIADRSVRYHLSMLVERKLIAAHGEKRGRYYTRAAEATSDETVSSEESVNDAVLADILELGGSVTAQELHNLVLGRGGDPRMIGSLHGRRLAHLTRNSETGRSTLTARGREIAEQYLFAKRLSSPKQSP
jgi:Fic family protein